MVAFNTPTLLDAKPQIDRRTEPDAWEQDGIAGRIGPSQIDRRIFPRREMSLRIGGRRLDHSVRARQEPALNLNVRDVSVGGLRAISQARLDIGERVAVFFPPNGAGRGWDAYGRVLRSAPAGGAGCEVAVEFEMLPAA
jgi:hypothetical protein